MCGTVHPARLPGGVIKAKSVMSFEAKLDKFWENQETIYNHEAKLKITPGHHISIYYNNDEDLDIAASTTCVQPLCKGL